MPKNAFVLMPFASEFDEVYEFLLREPLERAGYSVARADDVMNQRNILEDIVSAIEDCDLVIADLTTMNPNVYYELGLAHALRKNVVLLTQEISEIPFDLKSYRILKYSTHFNEMNKARTQIESLLIEISNGGVNFGSPFSDFSKRDSDYARTANSANHSTGGVDDERGLFDYRAELEDSLESISAIAGQVGNHFSKLTPSLQSAQERILGADANSAKKQRAIMRNIAEEIDEFSNWLQGGNDSMDDALSNMSDCLNAIFGGEFPVDDNGVLELKNFIEVISSTEAVLRSAYDSFSSTRATIDALPRIEKTFNRAGRRMSSELKKYIDNVDRSAAILSRTRLACLKLIGETVALPKDSVA